MIQFALNDTLGFIQQQKYQAKKYRENKILDYKMQIVHIPLENGF